MYLIPWIALKKNTPNPSSHAPYWEKTLQFKERPASDYKPLYHVNIFIKYGSSRTWNKRSEGTAAAPADAKLSGQQAYIRDAGQPAIVWILFETCPHS